MKKENKTEKKNKVASNTWNIIKIVGYSVLFFVTLFFILFLGKNGMAEKNITIVLLCVLLFSILLIGAVVLDCITVRKINKKGYIHAYSFNYGEELKIYKRIGKDKKKENDKKQKKKNKTQTEKGDENQENTEFSKYSEWRDYIDVKYKDRINNENFYHFTISILKYKNDSLDGIKTILIPIEIAMVTTLYGTIKENVAGFFVSVVCVTLFMVVLFAIEMRKYKTEIYFIEDYMKLVFPKYE